MYYVTAVDRAVSSSLGDARQVNLYAYCSSCHFSCVYVCVCVGFDEHSSGLW